MTKRLFLAIALPEEWKVILAAWQENYERLRGVRWTPKENLHITLAFLGDVDQDRIQDLIHQLEPRVKEAKSFNLEFKEVVLAPPGRKPKMIWADFFGNLEFNDVVKKVWSVAENYVLSEIYDKIKSPAIHVTLARFRQPIYLSGLKQPVLKGKSFKVEGIELMESELTSERPYYKRMKEFELD